MANESEATKTCFNDLQKVFVTENGSHQIAYALHRIADALEESNQKKNSGGLYCGKPITAEDIAHALSSETDMLAKSNLEQFQEKLKKPMEDVAAKVAKNRLREKMGSRLKDPPNQMMDE
jgi:hypothetical protein